MYNCSGSNTDYKSSEPLKTLDMLCYVIRGRFAVQVSFSS